MTLKHDNCTQKTLKTLKRQRNGGVLSPSISLSCDSRNENRGVQMFHLSLYLIEIKKYILPSHPVTSGIVRYWHAVVWLSQLGCNFVIFNLSKLTCLTPCPAAGNYKF